MKPDSNNGLMFLWFMVWLGCIGMGLLYEPPRPALAQSSTTPDRLDFVATEGQTTFPTAPVFPKIVVVYRNGLLQRQGADYTQTTIQNGARIRITFNTPTESGAYVTLFYYR